MSNEKKYVPKSSAKETTFPDGGSILKLSFKADELIEFIRANTNSKGYINLGVSRRREPGRFGDTHGVWLDTWQPDPNRRRSGPEPSQPGQPSQPEQERPEPDDVPF